MSAHGTDSPNGSVSNCRWSTQATAHTPEPNHSPTSSSTSESTAPHHHQGAL